MRLGLTHIADVRIEWSDQEMVAELAPTVSYLHHGIDDAGQQVPYRWFEDGVDWVASGLEGGGVVLAHCHMGINRGPSLGFATLLGLDWDPIDALDTIRSARPIAAIGYAEDALPSIWIEPPPLPRVADPEAAPFGLAVGD